MTTPNGSSIILTTSQTWDSGPPSDPIADIKRAMESASCPPSAEVLEQQAAWSKLTLLSNDLGVLVTRIPPVDIQPMLRTGAMGDWKSALAMATQLIAQHPPATPEERAAQEAQRREAARCIWYVHSSMAERAGRAVARSKRGDEMVIDDAIPHGVVLSLRRATAAEARPQFGPEEINEYALAIEEVEIMVGIRGPEET